MANYNTLRVEGFESLIKDVDTKAIINTNRSEYNSYMVRVKSRETNSDTIRSLCKEINILKKELFEIKKELENNRKG
jgi:GTP cyclohydrolase II|tara:strand:- start:305 stop:535 length:231 start_codon:yes stop_codon:yes gene_type:complete